MTRLVSCTFLCLRSAQGRWSQFLIRTTDDIVTAQLIAVDDGPDCPGLEQFSIVFEGDELDDGLYDTYHPEMDGLAISLMPSDARGTGRVRKRAFFALLV